jgi:ATP-dependent protease ClpP protease subunit
MAKKNFLIFLVDNKREINTACLNAVEKSVSDKKGDHLYLVLQTYGGDPFSAVAIMNLLRQRFKSITSIVPNYSKSAGTLNGARDGTNIYER